MNQHKLISLTIIFSLLLTFPLWAAQKDKLKLIAEHGSELKSADFPIRYKFEQETGRPWAESTESQREAFLTDWHKELAQEALKEKAAKQESLKAQQIIKKEKKEIKRIKNEKIQKKKIKERNIKQIENNKKEEFKKKTRKEKERIRKFRELQKSRNRKSQR